MSNSLTAFSLNAFETLLRVSRKLEVKGMTVHGMSCLWLPTKPVNVSMEELDWERSGVPVWEEGSELGVAVREWRGVPERGVADSGVLILLSWSSPRSMSSWSSSLELIRSSGPRADAAEFSRWSVTFSFRPFVCIKIWKDKYQSAKKHAQLQTNLYGSIARNNSFTISLQYAERPAAEFGLQLTPPLVAVDAAIVEWTCTFIARVPICL